MRNEVEIKAHVFKKNIVSLTNKLSSLFGEYASENKSDTYYKDDNQKDVRIRKESNVLIFTKKEQAMKGSVEINKEYERIITEKEKNELEKQLTPFLKKSKKGFIWNSHFQDCPMHIELLRISGYYTNNKLLDENREKDLGYFLETEILIESENLDEIEFLDKTNEANQYLINFYKELGLKDTIEKRKYMEMLKV